LVDIKPASTVVIVRDGDDGVETLMLRRNADVKFAGGAWVFPGGRVDEADYAAAADEEHARRLAAVRECMEEAGLDVPAEALLNFAHWVTPANMHKRFSTSFYVCAVEGDHVITVDGSEIHDYAWMKPDDALAAHRSGDMQLMPPTYITLLELAAQASVADLLAAYQARGPRRYEPCVTFIGDQVCFLYEGDAGYAAEDPAAEGERHRTLLVGGCCDFECSFGMF